ncbi:glycosyltransferase [Sulfurospirillum sp. 1612]|uniref:glycosyltransferase n=1 Tax=Sulfurospirillum sp. 1612 TaxID=3094835 RepID=UPI002F95ED7C
MNLAPIVLFVYNRPDHTKQTVEALQKNELANKSELFVYSDEAKNENARKSVDEVRKYLESIDGFKKVTIIKREKNWGLANSIIDGVTSIVNEYGKIIVLEDDLVTSPYFLKFMNEALEFYKDEKKVWHVSGWNYPIYSIEKNETFLWKKMNCWGWATWKDRWGYFDKNPKELMNLFNNNEIKEFDLDGIDSNWQQVINNYDGKINTWAVFWHTSIFKNKGLCLNPYTSFVTNIGHDGSGIHCGNSYEKDIDILNYSSEINFTKNILEDSIQKNLVKKYLQSKKKNIFIRIINKLARMIIGKNVIK